MLSLRQGYRAVSLDQRAGNRNLIDQFRRDLGILRKHIVHELLRLPRAFLLHEEADEEHDQADSKRNQRNIQSIRLKPARNIDHHAEHASQDAQRQEDRLCFLHAVSPLR